MAAYTLTRVFFYAFAWVSAVVLLGLTGYRVHWTRQNLSDHDQIVVELLVTASLTILFAPVIIAQALASRTSRFTTLTAEFFITGTLWIMYLVGGAIATNKWPSKHICEANPAVVKNVVFGSVVNSKQCHTLLAIVAFAWISFAALTFAGVVALMQWAAESAAPAVPVVRNEKAAPATV